MPATIFESSIGPLTIVVRNDGALESIHFGFPSGFVAAEESKCSRVVQQLAEYLRRERKEFDLALAPRGTEFQLSVWRELQRIPYGTTITYSALAQRIGRPSAVRAVGAANGANPIPIVIPCHRVIGANGTLTGYGGGLAVKRALLAVERDQRSVFSER